MNMPTPVGTVAPGTLEAAARAVIEAGSRGFATCRSGGGSPPSVAVEFRCLEDAQRYYGTLLDLTQAVRAETGGLTP